MIKLNMKDAQSVLQQAQDIKGLASEINQLFSQLSNEVSSQINSCWRGTSANNFRNAWEDLATNLNSYSEYLNDVGQRAENSANAIINAES